MNVEQLVYKLKQKIKPVLYRLGAFRVIRNLYRTIDSHHRNQKRNNRAFYERFVEAGDLCFDIGANLGQTAEALISNDCKVVSVEPNPKSFNILSRQYTNNPNVIVECVAVGKTAGVATLNFNGTESTASLLSDWPYSANEVTEVRVTTLDNLIETYGVPRLIKVDVEGFELQVFAGLSFAIEYIVFEVHYDAKDIAKHVLQHLGNIGTILGINAISGDCSDWIVEDWQDAAQVEAIWQATDHRYVNMIVKMSL